MSGEHCGLLRKVASQGCPPALGDAQCPVRISVPALTTAGPLTTRVAPSTDNVAQVEQMGDG
jgi:hypothetical protein